MAALLAQALSFIEEPGLDRQARTIQIEIDIGVNLRNLKKVLPEFEKCEDFLAKLNLDIEVKQILLDVLRYADMPTLETFSKSVKDFVKFTSEVIQDANNINLLWIDLIMMYEWDKELKNSLKKHEGYFKKDTEDQILNMFNRSRGKFDPVLVLEDLKLMMVTKNESYNEFLQSIIISSKIA